MVRVWSKPNGLPMAITNCPTRSLDESPSVTGTSRSAGAFTCT